MALSLMGGGAGAGKSNNEWGKDEWVGRSKREEEECLLGRIKKNKRAVRTENRATEVAERKKMMCKMWMFQLEGGTQR